MINRAMAVRNVQAQLDRVRYKHGWKFSADGDCNAIIITAQFNAPDADGKAPGLLPVRQIRLIDYRDDISPSRVNQEVYCLIRSLELHEIDEWLRVDGKHLHNPHPAPWETK